MRLLIFFLLVPFLLNSQSEGGFGYRRFSNTTTLNNVAPSNINTSHSRNAYVHSNGLYYVWDGNSWEREHDIDTLSFSTPNLSISLYGDGVPAKTVNLSGLEGINWYNTNDTTTNLLRTALILRSAWWRGLDSIGLIRWEIRPDNFDGSRFTIYQDSTVTDADTILWNSTWNPLQVHQFNATNTYLHVSKDKIFGIGEFPFFPTINFVGQEIGYFADPTNDAIYIISGDTVNDITSYYRNDGSSSTLKSTYNGTDDYESELTISASGLNTTGTELNTGNYYSIVGGVEPVNVRLRLRVNNNDFFGDSTSFIDLYQSNDGDRNTKYTAMGERRTSGGSALGNVAYLGKALDDATEANIFSRRLSFGVQQVKPGANWWFDHFKIYLDSDDTTINTISYYGDSYYFPNARPSLTSGDSSLIVWTGDGVNAGKNPIFIDIDDIKGSPVNIYNADGTQDDADRYFTIDSSRTFAMGQFNSFPASTWGRGFYYDPSNNDGIRILNKDGSNTSTTKVELDPFGITIHSDFSNSDATHTFSGLSESANQVLSVDRTSDTYGAISIAEVTNTNEEIVALVQNGKGTTPNVSMYLGDGYASSQYAKYTARAWGVQSHVTSGSFDWIQVLLPDTGTDTTGNNLNFYNRKYYWVNTAPSPTVGDSSVHIWVGNGTTTNPMFVPFSAITAGAPNIYNTNGTTTDNTRIATITESIQWVGTADLGVDAYPFQIHSTGNEPLIQLWKGNTDSVYLYQSDVEYVFGSSTRMVIWPQSDLTIIADSTAIQGVQDVTKVRRLMGVAASGYLKAIDGDALTAGTILKSDGTDFTTGDWLSTYSSATQSTSAWNATNAASNVNAAIVPKGTGAFTLDVPDGGTGGGNSRGADAVDLQTTRDAATQVASGTYSGIFAGRRNTASGTAAVVLGGADNIVTGPGSFIVGGYSGTSVGGAHLVSGTNSGILGGVQDTVTGSNSYVIGAQSVASSDYTIATGALSRAYLLGQQAFATSSFVSNNPGFSQSSKLMATREITGTSQAELFIDNTAAQAILLGTNRSWNFSIQIVGICSTVGNGVGITAGDTWTSWHVGGIKRLNTTTSLVGTVQLPATAQSDAGMSTTTVTIDADDSTEALRIRVTPPSTAGTTTIIRWVAYISLAESAY